MKPSTAAVSSPAVAHRAIAPPAVLLGALGVVFGDIGTSPIYAFRESLRAGGGATARADVFGILSLIFWAVVLIVAIKYVVVVMRADNHGEGGTMALLSLALPAAGRLRQALLVVGLAGASLFFGDAMITPAISVLSAVEGLELALPSVKAYVVPIAAGVLIALFAIQRHGSGRVGKLFGPVMAAWFASLAISGIVHIVEHPHVLEALNPLFALAYVRHADAWVAFTVLGSVFLALTGGEALYADMGHFGRRAIRIDWFVLVMPALVLNYLGQGAVVLAEPQAAANPFFRLFDSMLLLPSVVLATAATVIASQAVISGAFALVQQAIQLGVLPRLNVKQTSDESMGQVYVPQANWLLAVAVIGLVLGFRSSDALANAYGIAVAGDMLVTSLLVTTVARGVWRWPWTLVAPVMGILLVLDFTFVSANVHKIPAGGWFPLLVGAVALTLMLVWRRGRAVALAKRDERATRL
ncbi:MAG: KUP/HAK/KT family potassium transporter, partial [Rhizobacter sp.]|nr:KUP/HAK/KT family potassium transporter [Rhizobacter sp.]